ncbi:helix-turn-helix transcriptional regulator [Nocardia terpenica]|uniref:helix-turn-helix domain-containing protein n=1 Tax=Nocardia terpenica TaxID=455432 RepID=UPI001893714D|nr:helix-turn-helix domain-containing protein [Nocardia terpenica]MBF6065301.1 helix-turn-helix transcriptional regulator [Nocardia terpenica]MBF6108028.1 helix-turn-helix transcriptional regulator [Nocardia terpenica]MBF6115441.1 helix-turn-helix transcriptional regulator [Nocardia terpenica]MBF6121878.1 helix-turn-helix transcriptional regulator [Nocardia terpenica]MBF6155578.1 helix-turn-helix transcriptional regulator [Nocardia terpenica]
MKRIHFTPDDLMRVRVGASLGAFGETVLAARMFQHTDAALFDGWRRQVCAGIPDDFGLLAELLPPDSCFVDLITPVRSTRSLPEGVEALRLASRDELRREVDEALNRRIRQGARVIPEWAVKLSDRDGGTLREVVTAVETFHSVAFAGRWVHVQTHLDLAYERMARTLATEGVERLLAELPGRWRAPVLDIPIRYSSGDLHLGGRGLVVVPSLFAWPDPVLLKSTVDADASPQLVVPVLRQPSDLVAAWGPRPGGEALVALLGRTRAAALEAIAAGCTTTELARRLGISPATASEHASILRRAGLVDSRRYRNTMQHEVTTLGAALLDGEPDRRGVRIA